MAALMVLATAALSSCMQEKSFKDVKIGENDIVFSLQHSVSTRAAEVASVQSGVKLELDASDDGQKLFLEETIEDLNYTSPATKGTPAYTENVGKLYENLGDVIKNGDTELLNTTGFYAMDDEMVGDGWRYQGEFSGWPKNAQGDYTDTALDFYLWMPVSNNGITGTPTYGKASGKQTISFSYTSPESASAQKDLIFAARPLSKSEHDTKLPNGAPVLFNHALTGVKFAIANYDTDKQISITSISFKGLVGTASCVVTPAVENNYRDNITNYTSGTQAVVNWTIPENADRSKTYSSGTYADTVYYAPKGSFENNGNYPSSFSEGGNKHNLNDADATQTFWFIPQTITDALELTIKYTFGSTEERTGVLKFGKALGSVTWKAGELRTYTIRVDEVNVKIEDAVEAIEKPNTVLIDSKGNVVYKVDEEGHPTTEPYKFTAYVGTKSNVGITNTGNTDAYIRAAIVGQWLDEQGRPVFGFTDAIGNIYLVDSWYQDQFVNHKGVHGYFVDLPGYRNDDTKVNKDAVTQCSNPLHDWYLCDDGYYYYKNIVPAGDPIPANNPLFTSYTVGRTPAVAVAGAVKNVYFQLEVSTQAISAKNTDGSSITSWQAAWARTNTANTQPSYVEITVQNGD